MAVLFDDPLFCGYMQRAAQDGHTVHRQPSQWGGWSAPVGRADSGARARGGGMHACVRGCVRACMHESAQKGGSGVWWQLPCCVCGAQASPNERT
jgi:hypothetical protein